MIGQPSRCQEPGSAGTSFLRSLTVSRTVLALTPIEGGEQAACGCENESACDIGGRVPAAENEHDGDRDKPDA